MGSSGKKKTTMAKLMRESRLRERRLDKQARKDARKLAAADGSTWIGEPLDADGMPIEPGAGAQTDREPIEPDAVVQPGTEQVERGAADQPDVAPLAPASPPARP